MSLPRKIMSMCTLGLIKYRTNKERALVDNRRATKRMASEYRQAPRDQGR